MNGRWRHTKKRRTPSTLQVSGVHSRTVAEVRPTVVVDILGTTLPRQGKQDEPLAYCDDAETCSGADANLDEDVLHVLLHRSR